MKKFALSLLNKKSGFCIYTLIILSVLIVWSNLEMKIQASMPPPVVSQSSFENYLIRTGMPVYSKYKGYVASYEIYRDYNLICYGKPQNVPANRYDSKTGEYEVLGYSFDEYLLYNTFFPEDFPSTSDPRYWNRINIGQDAYVSWMRLTSRQKEHIKATKLYYMGNSFNNMNYTNLNLTEGKSVVLAIPSLYLGFFLHTNHLDSNGNLRYATFHGDGIGQIVIDGNITITAKDGRKDLVMTSQEEYIDIIFKINSKISKYLGLARSSDIYSGGIKIFNHEISTSGSSDKTLEFTRRYYRGNFSQTVSVTNNNKVSATIWYVSQMGDLTNKTISLEFDIIEEPRVNYDINVSISMEGQIGAFKNEKTLLGNNLPFNKLRFLCLEKVKIRVDFIDSFIPKMIRVYLVGARFIDLSVVKISDREGYAEYSYTIGILNSTLDWNNNRIRAPEKLVVQMIIDGKLNTFELAGIEITGSIHDLVYIHAD